MGETCFSNQMNDSVAEHQLIFFLETNQDRIDLTAGEGPSRAGQLFHQVPHTYLRVVHVIIVGIRVVGVFASVIFSFC